MEPETIIEGILKEISVALDALSKAKTAEEKLAYSVVIKNLSASFGVFFDVSDAFDDFEDDEEEGY